MGNYFTREFRRAGPLARNHDWALGTLRLTVQMCERSLPKPIEQTKLREQMKRSKKYLLKKEGFKKRTMVHVLIAP